mmetsp:Transcript_9450/g.33225  ORF Transcript_9450/g.33225 Transcript_9450/m.33225 type:complete len:475 (+) Transcript_9450:917-2341(+)
MPTTTNSLDIGVDRHGGRRVGGRSNIVTAHRSLDLARWPLRVVTLCVRLAVVVLAVIGGASGARAGVIKKVASGALIDIAVNSTTLGSHVLNVVVARRLTGKRDGVGTTCTVRVATGSTTCAPSGSHGLLRRRHVHVGSKRRVRPSSHGDNQRVAQRLDHSRCRHHLLRLDVLSLLLTMPPCIACSGCGSKRSCRYDAQDRHITAHGRLHPGTYFSVGLLVDAPLPRGLVGLVAATSVDHPRQRRLTCARVSRPGREADNGHHVFVHARRQVAELDILRLGEDALPVQFARDAVHAEQITTPLLVVFCCLLQFLLPLGLRVGLLSCALSRGAPQRPLDKPPQPRQLLDNRPTPRLPRRRCHAAMHASRLACTPRREAARRRLRVSCSVGGARAARIDQHVCTTPTYAPLSAALAVSLDSCSPSVSVTPRLSRHRRRSRRVWHRAYVLGAGRRLKPKRHHRHHRRVGAVRAACTA